MEHKKKSYSTAEKRAYYMGLGAALGHGTVKGIKQTLNSFPDKKMKDSYSNGLDDGLKRNTKFRKK